MSEPQWRMHLEAPSSSSFTRSHGTLLKAPKPGSIPPLTLTRFAFLARTTPRFPLRTDLSAQLVPALCTFGRHTVRCSIESLLSPLSGAFGRWKQPERRHSLFVVGHWREGGLAGVSSSHYVRFGLIAWKRPSPCSRSLSPAFCSFTLLHRRRSVPLGLLPLSCHVLTAHTSFFCIQRHFWAG